MNYHFHSFRDLGDQKLNCLQIRTSMSQSSILYCSQEGSLEQNLNWSPQHSQSLNLIATHVTNNSVKCQEISFERHFLEEHIKAFDKETKNFMEIFSGPVKIRLEKIQKGLNENENEISRGSLQNHSFISEMWFLLRNQVYGCQKLLDFFSYVERTVPSQFMPWYLCLWKILRPEYFRIKDIALNQEDIMRYVKKIVNERFLELQDSVKTNQLFQESEKNPIIPPPQNSLKKSFKQYIQFFFTTLILINEQYFTNPYSQKGFSCPSSTIQAEFSSIQEFCPQI